MNWTDRALIAALTRLLPTRRHIGFLITPATSCAGASDSSPAAGPPNPRRPADHPSPPACAHSPSGWPPRTPPGGYRRSHGELTGLGYQIGASTIWTILHSAGIDPSPRRAGPTWAEFLRGPGARDPGLRFVPSRHHRPAPALHVLHHRARQPPGPHPRGHRAPDRSLADPASPQSDHGPRRCRTAVPVPHPRSRHQIHRPFDAVLTALNVQIIRTPVAGTAGQRRRRTLRRHHPP
jgi:hypothetical protein